MKKVMLLFAIAGFIVSCSSKTNENLGGNKQDAEPRIDISVSKFMATYDVPGMSVAVTHNGKLCFAKAYGFADKEKKENVSVSTLFRIASVSKTVTSICLMKLIEEGKLGLDDKVFGPGSILGTLYGTPPYKQYVTDITVRQLMHHTAGGWSNETSDPMFQRNSSSAQELLTWTLDTYKLNNVPGTQYAYSNFGYFVLGRVIEKVTGKNYDEYVKSGILAQAGVTTMVNGGNTEADKKPNEAKYYGQDGENPYIYNISRMDAHGGWIASATDLVRLLVRADGFSNKPDILTAASIKTMTTGSSANPEYGLGWGVNGAGTWSHGGSLPGTSSLIVRNKNGFIWAIVMNTRSSKARFDGDMNALISNLVNNSNIKWPDTDLF